MGGARLAPRDAAQLPRLPAAGPLPVAARAAARDQGRLPARDRRQTGERAGRGAWWVREGEELPSRSENIIHRFDWYDARHLSQVVFCDHVPPLWKLSSQVVVIMVSRTSTHDKNLWFLAECTFGVCNSAFSPQVGFEIMDRELLWHGFAVSVGQG